MDTTLLPYKKITTMSTRATLYIHWRDWEMDIKLYHHRDWYVDYLWVKLEKALEKWRKWKMKDEYWDKSKNLIECISSVWWFEQAFPIHWDVEYVYHIYYSIEWKRNAKKEKYEHIANYKLECQSWMDYWETILLEKPKVLLCMKRWNEKKKLEPKKAELQLWNRDKFRADYFNSLTQ